MKLRPNLFLALLLLISIVLLGLLGSGGIYLGYLVLKDGSYGFAIFTIILSLGFLFLIYLMWESVKSKIIFVSLANNILRVHKPLVSVNFNLDISGIKGFSKSLDDKYYGGPIQLKKNVVTLYFKEHFEPIELVQFQVTRVREFEAELIRNKVELLGTEEIHRDIWGQRKSFKYQ